MFEHYHIARTSLDTDDDRENFEEKFTYTNKVISNKELFLHLATFCQDIDAVRLFTISKFHSSLTQFHKLYNQYRIDKLEKKGFLIRNLELTLPDVPNFCSNHKLIFIDDSITFREQILDRFEDSLKLHPLFSVLNLSGNQDLKDELFRRIHSAKVDQTLSLISRYKSIECIILDAMTRQRDIRTTMDRTKNLLGTGIKKFKLLYADDVPISSDAEPISLEVQRIDDLYLNYSSLLELKIDKLKIEFIFQGSALLGSHDLVSSCLYELPVLRKLTVESIMVDKLNKKASKNDSKIYKTEIFPRSLIELHLSHSELSCLISSLIRIDLEELVELENLYYIIDASFTELNFNKLTKLKNLDTFFPLNPLPKSIQKLTISLPRNNDVVLSDGTTKEITFTNNKINDLLEQFNGLSLTDLEFNSGTNVPGNEHIINNLPESLKRFRYIDSAVNIKLINSPKNLEELCIQTSLDITLSLNSGLLSLNLRAEDINLLSELPESITNLKIDVPRNWDEQIYQDQINFIDLEQKVETWKNSVRTKPGYRLQHL